MKQLIKKLIFFIISPFVIKKHKTNNVYITFDDGPHPENTLKVINALKIAKKRIYDYHQKQMPQDFQYIDELENKLGNKWLPIQKI